MAGLSAPGIGSGLDVSSLVQQLVAVEAEPLVNRLNQREAGIQARISAFGFLKSALSQFGEATSALKSLATFQGRSASSSNKELFTATATSSAASGSFSVDVVSLAEAQKIASAGSPSSSSVIGSGELSIQSGTVSFNVTIDSGATTLADIRDAINGAGEDIGVSATTITVDDGGGGSVTKLLLTADKTGTSNELTLTVVDDDGNDTDNAGLSQLVFDPDGSGIVNMSEVQAASDAQILLDNQAVTSATNTISGAIEGVTINLLSASPGNAAALTVKVDNGAVTQAVNDFVSKYNELRTTLTDLTKFNAETGESGTLIGDSGLLSINRQLQSVLGSRQLIAGSFLSLSDLGVQTQTDGTLKFEEGQLDELLTENPAAIAELFTGKDGVATRLDAVVSGLVGASGTLDSRTQVLTEQISGIGDERRVVEARLQSLEERLLRQFSAMDALVAQLTATSNFLTQQLAGLQNLSNNSNRSS